MHAISRLSTGVLLCFVLANCATSRFAKPIETFGTALTSAAPVLKGYYQGLNSFERKVYMDERALDQTQDVFLIKDHKNTPLAGAISEKSLNARLDALTVLGAYAHKLANLSATSAGSDFQTATTDAGTAIGSLAGTFEKLAKSGDQSAQAYIGPISELVGLIGRSYIELKRDAALKQAILDGEKPVKKILNTLAKDLGIYRKLLVDTGYDQMIAIRISDYNQNKGTMTRMERQDALDKIVLYQEAAEVERSNSVGGLTSALQKSHSSLVSSARNNFATDFDTFMQGVSEILQRIDAVKTAAEKLKAK